MSSERKRGIYATEDCVCIYTHTHILRLKTSALKRKKILSFETIWVNLEDIMLCGIRQAQKNKYSTISLICEI